MKILQQAKPEMAFLKMGIYGGAGSGKTFTSTKIAIELHKYIKAKKPIAFADSETGSDFVLSLFEEAKIKLVVAKTRAFADLLDVVDEAEKECSILILDSITHFWNELMDAYQEKHELSRITLRHWIPLKQTWREFTEKYITSKLHIVMCGRASDVWEDVEDEDGILETKKTGTKMKAEVDTAYEPSLLVEMVKHRKSAKAGAGWVHRAWVVKDRFDVINGSHFDNPTLDCFLPHIEKLNLSGEHKAINTESDSQRLFNGKHDGATRLRESDILMEKIEAWIHLLIPGSNTSPEVKTKRLELMQEIFNSTSKKEIKGMDNAILEIGLIALKNKKKIKDKEKKEKKSG